MTGRRLIRWLAIALVLAALLPAAGMAVLLSVDLALYRGVLEERISLALGRAVSLNGAIRVQPSLWPTVVAQDVAISNAEWATQTTLGDARSLAVQLQLWPLLQGHLRIDRVALVQARLHLETRADGTSNWLFAAPGAAAGGEDAVQPLTRLPQVRVLDSVLDFRDGRSGVVTQLQVARAVLSAEAGRPLRLLLDATLRGQELSLEATGGPLADLLQGGTPWPISLSVRTGAARLDATGTLTRLPEPRFDLRLRASGDAFDALGSLVGVALPPLGPFELDAQLSRDAQGYEVRHVSGFLGPPQASRRFSVQDAALIAPFAAPTAVHATGTFRGLPFELRMSGAPYPHLLGQAESWPLHVTLRIVHTHLELDGDVHPIDGDFSVQVNADGAELTTLEPILQRTLPPLGPYALQGRLLRRGRTLALEDFAVRIGQSAAHGNLALDLVGALPHLSGTVQATLLRLADLRPAFPAPPPAAAAGGRPPGPLDAELPTERLAELTADLNLAVDEVQGAGSPLEHVQARLTLQGGVLTARDVQIQLAGEAITGGIALSGGAEPELRLDAHGVDIHYGPVLAALHVTQHLDGQSDRLDFTLRGRGRSVSAIWRSATLSLQTGPATLRVLRPAPAPPFELEQLQGAATLGPDAGLHLRATGRYRAQPFAVALGGDGLPELKDDSLPWHVRATGSLAGADVRLEGSLRAVFRAEGVNLRVQVAGPRLDALNALLDTHLPALGPYRASGRLFDIEHGLRIQGLEATLGESGVHGELSYAGGAAPRLVATLTSQSLRLADLLGRPPAPGATTAPTPGAATPPVPPAAADGGAAAGAAVEGAGPPDAEAARLVPDWPIPVALLQRLELELQLNGERVTLGRSELHGVALQARLRQGRLEINAQAAEMWGGALAASLRLDANEAPPLAALSLSLRGLDYTKTFAALGVSGFRTGRAEVALRLRGQGATLREALAAADGDAELFGSEGRIDSRFLKLWASDLLLALVPTFGDKKDGEVRCAVARFDVAKGKAETRSILLDVEHVIVKGVGTVQLGDESLDLLLWPEPRDASLISVTTPMRVTGTLAHPSVSPQPRGVVEDVAWLLIGAHNPFVLLLGIIKPSTVEQQPCVAALAGGDGPGKQEQNRPPNPLNKTQDFFRGLGRFLERSFGGD